MMMDAHGLDMFSRAMAEDNHLLAIDLLGHGDSDKPNTSISLEHHMEILRGVVQKRKFTQPVLIGHSIGGMLALVYTAKHPEEISKLILVDIAPMDPSRPRTGPSLAVPESFESEAKARDYFQQRFPRFTPEAYENRLKYGLIRDAEGKWHLKSSQATIAMLRESNLGVDLWPYVQQITVPTLLIKGRDSDTVSQQSSDKLKHAIRNFSMVEVAGATHTVPQDRPQEFEKTIRHFLG